MPTDLPTRTGGPKTQAGRSAVSKNAVTHGLTASRPTTVAEALAVESLRSDLLVQYKPQTALEVLQIDRIARSAAKLQRLHQIEEAAFQLALENALPNVTDIVAGMGPADAAVQSEAVHILQGGSQKPTLGLDDVLLEQLCDEIRTLGPSVATYADVQSRLPATHAYIVQCCEQMGTKDPGLQLQALVAWLTPLPAPPPLANLVKYTDEATVLATIAFADRERGVVSVRVRPANDPAALAQGLQDDLNALLRLQHHRQQVADLVQRYPARRVLLQQAALPPGDEADRLMRYQVALDRQLSKCVGELLQMMAMRTAVAPQPSTAPTND